jgi:hypothetical protein
MTLSWFVPRRAPDQKAAMTQVSAYAAAIIAGTAGVAGAAVPVIGVLIRDVWQARRDRRDGVAATKRQACLDLLRAAQLLRTKVANAAAYHGAEMSDRLEEIRDCDASVQFNAANAASLTAGNLGVLADSLADAASQLVDLAVRNTNMQAGEMDPKPDLESLNERIRAYRDAVVHEFRA